MNGWEQRILVLAPHADDETLGCGGLLAQHPGSERCVWVATLGRTPQGDHEQTLEELERAMRVLGVSQHTVASRGFQGRLAELGMSALVEGLDRAIARFQPTAVFAPYASHHQDHRTLYEATLAAMRPRASTLPVKLFALYEYPYAAAWPQPDLPGGKFYLPLTEEVLGRKLEALGHYATQFQRDTWCSLARVRSWAEMRGVEIGEAAAEAFWVVRGRLG